MNKDKVVWQDPPKGSRSRYYTKWAEIAEQLMKRPGKWAIVELCNTSIDAAGRASYIRSGRAASMPLGEFEAMSRTIGDEYRVYARYIGTDGEYE